MARRDGVGRHIRHVPQVQTPEKYRVTLHSCDMLIHVPRDVLAQVIGDFKESASMPRTRFRGQNVLKEVSCLKPFETDVLKTGVTTWCGNKVAAIGWQRVS